MAHMLCMSASVIHTGTPAGDLAAMSIDKRTRMDLNSRRKSAPDGEHTNHNPISRVRRIDMCVAMIVMQRVYLTRHIVQRTIRGMLEGAAVFTGEMIPKSFTSVDNKEERLVTFFRCMNAPAARKCIVSAGTECNEIGCQHIPRARHTSSHVVFGR